MNLTAQRSFFLRFFSGKQKTVRHCYFTVFKEFLVRRVGFEPATPWFVARYSIQLSYRRTLMTVITDGTSHFTEIF